MVDHITHPALLDLADFAAAHVGHDFVQNAHQHFVVAWCGHGQLVAVGRFATDVEPIELELAQAPDA
ncbi:hypothetical protein D3C75_1186470 [compost metagenome]